MPTLHSGQVKIIKKVFDTDKFYYIMNCSRQSGKTFMLEWLMLFNALNSKNDSYFVSPYYSQAKKSFNTLLIALSKTNIIKQQSLTELSLQFNNDSMLYFKGADNFDSLRGISPNYLYIDEFAFLKEDAWRQVLRPSLNVAGKKCYVASTPRTKDSDFYTLYMKGQETDSRNLSFHMTYRDNPLANLEEIEDAKRNLPTKIFDCEYEANFLDSGGEVFENVNFCCVLNKWQEPKVGEVYVAGIDLGRVNDYTVLTIMNTKRDVVFIYRDNQKEWKNIIKDLVFHLKRYKVRKCFVELNNVGDIVYELLKKECGSMIEGEWTGNNKVDMIETLVVEMQQKNIMLPTKELFEYAYNELISYSYEYNPKTRNLKYGARQGFHDDVVMSLAIALQCSKRQTSSGVKIYSIKNN